MFNASYIISIILGAVVGEVAFGRHFIHEVKVASLSRRYGSSSRCGSTGTRTVESFVRGSQYKDEAIHTGGSQEAITLLYHGLDSACESLRDYDVPG